MPHRFRRLIAATYTPMNDDGSLRLERVHAMKTRLRDEGVDGVFVCGTTGEFASLTLDERRELAETWCSAAAGELDVILHVGGTCLEDSRTLASHAAQVGATAVSAMAPYFFKPATLDDLVDYCIEITAAAPSLPFYYYHIPAMNGVAHHMADFLERAAPRMPTLAGVKYSHPDLMDFGRCVRLDGGRFEMLFGCDEMLLSSLVIGAHGAVGTTYGFAAPLYLRLIEAFKAGNIESAQAYQAQSMDMIATFYRYRGHPAMKAVMGLVGLDCGPVRPPLRPLSSEEADALCTALKRVGFMEFCSRGRPPGERER